MSGEQECKMCKRQMIAFTLKANGLCPMCNIADSFVQNGERQMPMLNGQPLLFWPKEVN